MIKEKEVRYFLFSQHLADGLRITLEIILPALVASQFGHLDIGLTMSTGAFCASMSDAPGPVEHKRNGMLYTTIIVFAMALLVGFINHNVILVGVFIVLAAFFFTMFTIYGNRAASVGTAALLIIILRMDTLLSPAQVLTDSLLLLAGGTWYMALALIFFRLRPYRPAQRALGECIHETANYLRIKAALYDTTSDIEQQFGKLVEQQVTVNEKQDAVRDLLFRNHEILKEPSGTARLLLLTFTEVIDLFEHIMATWYNYDSLRKRFGHTGIPSHVSKLISEIADELDHLGIAVQSNTSYRKRLNLLPQLELLKLKIDKIGDEKINIIVLKKILVNLRSLDQRIDAIQKFFRKKSEKDSGGLKGEYSRFVTHQPVDLRVFKDNLTFRSSSFRHSLRMSIACLIGFTIVKLIAYGHHSYWILLTLIIILKPAFGLTKQRNLERFLGTLGGGIIGVILIFYVSNQNILFALMLLFMIGTYTFQRYNYVVMVIFTTPFILLLFTFLGMPFVDIARERLLDTGIAVVISFLTSYLLFPHWESYNLELYILNVLKANIQYLKKLAELASGQRNSVIEYKLVRKGMFVSTANLAAAFRRMLSEPKSKQRNRNELYEFMVLNHVLASNIASLTSMRPGKEFASPSREVLRLVKRAIITLENGVQNLDKTYVPVGHEIELDDPAILETDTDKNLTDQLTFILRISSDIEKLTSRLSVSKAA